MANTTAVEVVADFEPDPDLRETKRQDRKSSSDWWVSKEVTDGQLSGGSGAGGFYTDVVETENIE